MDILLGANASNEQLFLKLGMSNRHGLIAGATGTGKTITLQIIAEQFSASGVPVFAADVKGDLSGLAAAGTTHPKVSERIDKIGIVDFSFGSSPVVPWDLAGVNGHRIRASVEALGVELMSNLLELNEVQEGTLYILFSVMREKKLPLFNLDDLRTSLIWLDENRAEIQRRFGNISTATIGAIQRRLHVLAEAGGNEFFSEPTFDVNDLMRTAADGRGNINLLDARSLFGNPRIYTSFLLWLLTELFQKLPEIGDPEKPKLVFFFDEAHLLFESAPPALLEKLEQVVRLIRSKGVGVYFVTQNPDDVPDDVLGQLGNRVQHALRAFTPRDQKAVRAAASTFRANPQLDTEKLITELGVGEALASVLSLDGEPSMVEEILVSPPRSRIGPLDEEERKALMQVHDFAQRYDTEIDRASAHEELGRLKQQDDDKANDSRPSEVKRETAKPARPGNRRQGYVEAFFKSLLRSLGGRSGRRLISALIKVLTGKR